MLMSTGIKNRISIVLLSLLMKGMANLEPSFKSNLGRNIGADMKKITKLRAMGVMDDGYKKARSGF